MSFACLRISICRPPIYYLPWCPRPQRLLLSSLVPQDKLINVLCSQTLRDVLLVFQLVCESGLCRCESDESHNCLWQCLTGCHPLLTAHVGESVPITAAITYSYRLSSGWMIVTGGLDILRMERWTTWGWVDRLGAADIPQVSVTWSKLMWWRGLVVLVLWLLFLSECLEQARWTVKEGAHDNDIITLKALIVPNTARKRER